MNRVLLASTALICLQGFALAQEQVPAPANLVDWNGAWLGAHGSWSQSDPDFSVTGDVPSDFHGDGLGAGVDGGYDWQAGPYVFGVIADFDYLDLGVSRDLRDGTGKGEAYDYDLDWVASARIRGGFVIDDQRLLIYGTGGFALASAGASVESYGTGGVFEGADSRSEMLSGTVFGGGVEYRVTPNWSFRAEYLRFDFEDFSVGGGTTGAQTLNLDPNLDQLRFGIAYRF